MNSSSGYWDQDSNPTWSKNSEGVVGERERVGGSEWEREKEWEREWERDGKEMR